MMVNTCKYNRILPPSSTRPSWSRIQSQLHPMDQYVIWNIPHMGPNIEAILEVTTSIHWETLLTQQDPPLECHRKNTFQIQLDNRISPVVSCKSSRMPEFLGFFSTVWCIIWKLPKSSLHSSIHGSPQFMSSARRVHSKYVLLAEVKMRGGKSPGLNTLWLFNIAMV